SAGLRRFCRTLHICHHRLAPGEGAAALPSRDRHVLATSLGHRRRAVTRRAPRDPIPEPRLRCHMVDSNSGNDARSDPPITAAAIALREVHKSFGPTKIIRGVSLAVPHGQRHAIIGPNGAGKTTLFNLISGRLTTTSGTIELNGVPVDGLPPHKINRLGLAR